MRTVTREDLTIAFGRVLCSQTRPMGVARCLPRNDAAEADAIAALEGHAAVPRAHNRYGYRLGEAVACYVVRTSTSMAARCPCRPICERHKADTPEFSCSAAQCLRSAAQWLCPAAQRLHWHCRGRACL